VGAIPPVRPAAAAAVAVFAIALFAALALGGCRRYAMPSADATYDTRGQVVEVPRDAGGELVVHHEAVSGFRDREGKPSEMESMSMPFAVAPTVALAGIAPGDKVEMTFEVRWTGEPALRIVALRELPESTALDLGGPQLEFVAPLGSGAAATPTATVTAAPTPVPTLSPDRPATDGPSAPPSETI